MSYEETYCEEAHPDTATVEREPNRNTKRRRMVATDDDSNKPQGVF